DTDPLNWGTECMLPNGGYNQNGKWWTEEDENHSMGWDRSGVGSCGPFTFHPGDVQEVDMAYVFANSYFSADSSKNLLIERLYELRQRVLDGEIVIPNDELDINEQSTSVHKFKIYPNPASEVIYIETEELRGGKAEYRIINTMGIVVASGSIMTETKNEINISGMKPGFYIITVITENGIISNKFIKH
ncbi:MAG: T9SS type A sorting domain-containing protein, partial [Bacteroidetes bacterium]|nr:T9SS type A sorting domain-containing protein [Bacteroidota bacterium]